MTLTSSIKKMVYFLKIEGYEFIRRDNAPFQTTTVDSLRKWLFNFRARKI